MKVELPMWRVALSMGILGVARVALVGSVRVAMMVWGFDYYGVGIEEVRRKGR